MPYYLITTRTSGGEETKRFLESEAFGFEVYRPVAKTRVLRSRQIVVVHKPLFPNYMFVKIGTGRSPGLIRRAPGVLDFVRFGKDPCRVLDREVDRLKSVEDYDGLIWVYGDVDFRKGDRVLWKTETFAKPIAALFGEMRGDKRALIFLSLLGRQVPAEVHPADLTRA